MENCEDFHSALANLGSSTGTTGTLETAETVTTAETIAGTTAGTIAETVTTAATAGSTSGRVPDGQQVEFSPPFFFDVFQPTDTFEPVYEYQYDEHVVQQIIGKGPLDQLLQAISMDQPTSTSSNFVERIGPRGLEELGAGYLTDSFVDDSAEIREAMIPDGFTTQHGGHYFGSGPLGIRPFQPGEKETHVFSSISIEDCKRRLEEFSSGSSSSLNLRNQNGNFDLKLTEPKKKRMRKSVETTPISDHLQNFQKKVLVFTESFEDLMQNQEKFPQQENVQFGKDEDGPDKQAGSAIQLLDELPESLRVDIEKLRKLREDWTGTKSQFLKVDRNPELDVILLRIEYSLRELPSTQHSNSKLVYDYLTEFMQCTKKTIVARARKIRKEDVNKKSEAILKNLLNCLLGDSDAKNPRNKVKARKLAEKSVRIKLMAVDLHKDKDRRTGAKSSYLEEWFATEIWQDILCQPRCGMYGLVDLLNSFLKEK